MARIGRITSMIFALTSLVLVLFAAQSAYAESAAKINRDVDSALKKLYKSTPAAKELSGSAKGILVFPSIVKGGLIIGGQYGEGALRVEGKTAGYYSTSAVSYGLQAGGQKFGYALFFMTDSALDYLGKSDGWEVGSGPSVVIVDTGTAKSLSTTTAKSDVYAFFFNQKGLMAGIGLQGTKITKIKK